MTNTLEIGDELDVVDSQHQTMVVFEGEPPVDTGLVDAHGVKIFRVTERAPIGFHTGRKRTG